MSRGFGDEIMLLEGFDDVSPDQALDIAQKLPQDIRGATANIAKRVAANIIRAPKYRLEILNLNKAGKLTPGLVSSYKDWFEKASKLQQLLAKQFDKPGNRAPFVKKIKQAGLDPDQVIDALSKTPLAVADLSKSSAVDGFEAFFLIALPWILSAVGVLAVWKAPDAIAAWANLRREGTAREIVEAQIECLKSGTDPAKCDSMAEVDKRSKENQDKMSIWPWFIGGIAVTGLGLFWMSRKKLI